MLCGNPYSFGIRSYLSISFIILIKSDSLKIDLINWLIIVNSADAFDEKKIKGIANKICKLHLILKDEVSSPTFTTQ